MTVLGSPESPTSFCGVIPNASARVVPNGTPNALASATESGSFSFACASATFSSLSKISSICCAWNCCCCPNRLIAVVAANCACCRASCCADCKSVSLFTRAFILLSYLSLIFCAICRLEDTDENGSSCACAISESLSFSKSSISLAILVTCSRTSGSPVACMTCCTISERVPNGFVWKPSATASPEIPNCPSAWSACSSGGFITCPCSFTSAPLMVLNTPGLTSAVSSPALANACSNVGISVVG